MCKKIVNTLPRLFSGILFLVAGLMKMFVITPEVFSGTISNIYGMSMELSLVVAWVVIVIEIVGGFVLILGNKIPKKVFQNLIRLLVLVTLVAIYVHKDNFVEVMKNLILVVVLAQICHSKITCPMGITGDKE